MTRIRAGLSLSGIEKTTVFVWTAAIAILDGIAIVCSSAGTWGGFGITVLVLSALAGMLILLRNDVAGLVVVLLGLGLAAEARIYIYGMSFAVIELVSICLTLLLILLLPSLQAEELGIFPYEALLFLFLAFRLSIIPFSPDPRHAFSDLRDWLWPVLILSSLRRILKEERLWWLARNGFLVGAAISAAYGIGEAYFGLPAPFINASALGKTFIDFDRMEFQRVVPAVGFQEHPNAFAIYLVIAIILLIPELRDSREIIRKGFLALFIFLLMTGLFFTYTKTAFAGLVLCFVAVPFIHRWKLSIRKTILIAGMGILAASVMIHALERSNSNEVLATYYSRQLAWEVSLDTLTIPSVLLFGNGLERVLARSGLHPHNAWLYMLVSYGLIGAAIIAIVMLSVARKIITRARGMWSAGYSGLAEAMAMLSLYLCLTSFFESIVLGVNERCLLAFVGGLLLTWPLRKGMSPAAGE